MNSSPPYLCPKNFKLKERCHFAGIILFLILTHAHICNAEESLQEAYRLLSASQWEEAIIAYESIAERPSVPAQALFNMGIAYYRTQRYSSAQLAFEEAVHAMMDQPQFQAKAVYNIGNTLFQKSRLYYHRSVEESLIYAREAAGAYSSVLELVPDHVQANKNLDIARSVIASIERELMDHKSENDDETASDESEDAPSSSEDEPSQNISSESQDLQSPPPQSGSQQGNEASESSDQSPESGTTNSLPSESAMNFEEAMLLLDSLIDEKSRVTLSELEEPEDPETGKPKW